MQATVYIYLIATSTISAPGEVRPALTVTDRHADPGGLVLNATQATETRAPVVRLSAEQDHPFKSAAMKTPAVPATAASMLPDGHHPNLEWIQELPVLAPTLLAGLALVVALASWVNRRRPKAATVNEFDLSALHAFSAFSGAHRHAVIEKRGDLMRISASEEEVHVRGPSIEDEASSISPTIVVDSTAEKQCVADPILLETSHESRLEPEDSEELCLDFDMLAPVRDLPMGVIIHSVSD